MYVFLFCDVNLVSSLVKMYVCPVAVLRLTFARMLIEEATEYLHSRIYYISLIVRCAFDLVIGFHEKKTDGLRNGVVYPVRSEFI
jgi:hypothetical protein